MLNRRRFLAISAAAFSYPAGTQAAPLHIETGVALGARVTLRLSHDDAPRIAAGAMAEIRRLERIFSIYDPASSLSLLNQQARLDVPPPELLECLSLADAVHHASGGLFDPTIQPLWRARADAANRGVPLSITEQRIALSKTGWPRVRTGSENITMAPGMSLTLNGIAQGYIADRLATLLELQGLRNVLIDAGELVALGGQPETGLPWLVTLPSRKKVGLRSRSLSTSAPLGTTFGKARSHAHILDPRTGNPTKLHWGSVSVSSVSAAVADAVSTSACLMKTQAEIEALCAAFPETALVSTTKPEKEIPHAY